MRWPWRSAPRDTPRAAVLGSIGRPPPITGSIRWWNDRAHPLTTPLDVTPAPWHEANRSKLPGGVGASLYGAGRGGVRWPHLMITVPDCWSEVLPRIEGRGPGKASVGGDEHCLEHFGKGEYEAS